MNECVTGRNLCEQICIDNIGSYSCDCKNGYLLHSNGFYCEGIHVRNIYKLGSNTFAYFSDINECLVRGHNCNLNAICENNIGSFSCHCKPGFSGNGIDCNGMISLFVFIFWFNDLGFRY